MAKLTGQEMVQVLKEETNVSSLVSKFEDFVNSFLADTKGFIESLKNEEEAVKIRFATISLLWVKKCNYFQVRDFYDLRNEYSIQTSCKIYSVLGDTLKNFEPGYGGYIPEKSVTEIMKDMKNGVEPHTQSFEVSFVEEMSRSHRTLQQTFSGMVFNWLYVMGESMTTEFFIDVAKTIQSNFEDDISRTPFI